MSPRRLHTLLDRSVRLRRFIDRERNRSYPSPYRLMRITALWLETQRQLVSHAALIPAIAAKDTQKMPRRGHW